MQCLQSKQNEIKQNLENGILLISYLKIEGMWIKLKKKKSLNKLLVTCICVKKNLMYTKHEDVVFWGLFETYIIYSCDPYYIFTCSPPQTWILIIVWLLEKICCI